MPLSAVGALFRDVYHQKRKERHKLTTLTESFKAGSITGIKFEEEDRYIQVEGILRVVYLYDSYRIETGAELTTWGILDHGTIDFELPHMEFPDQSFAFWTRVELKDSDSMLHIFDIKWYCVTQVEQNSLRVYRSGEEASFGKIIKVVT